MKTLKTKKEKDGLAAVTYFRDMVEFLNNRPEHLNCDKSKLTLIAEYNKFRAVK